MAFNSFLFPALSIAVISKFILQHDSLYVPVISSFDPIVKLSEKYRSLKLVVSRRRPENKLYH